MRSLDDIRRTNAPPIVLGLDPGFASIGWAKVRLYERHEELLGLGVFRTEKSNKKRNVLAADDNLRRARLIASFLARMCIDRDLHAERVAVICAESMSFPRNASVAAKMALCWGAVAATADRCGLPIVQASPKEIKRAVYGSASASKDDVQRELRARFSTPRRGRPVRVDVAGEMLEKDGLPVGMYEHAFDALASIVACLESDVVRLARRAVA